MWRSRVWCRNCLDNSPGYCLINKYINKRPSLKLAGGFLWLALAGRHCNCHWNTNNIIVYAGWIIINNYLHSHAILWPKECLSFPSAIPLLFLRGLVTNARCYAWKCSMWLKISLMITTVTLYCCSCRTSVPIIPRTSKIDYYGLLYNGCFLSQTASS